MEFYLTGTTHYIGTEQAALEHVAKQSQKSVIRQDSDKTFSIFYLDTTPRHPGQHPFELRDDEQPR